VLELKAPKMVEHYQIDEIEGIRFYIPKRLPTKAGKVEFFLEKIMFIKRLDVKGVNLRT
jgi:hypothetical protein